MDNQYQEEKPPFWSLPMEELYQRYGSRPEGLSAQEAEIKLRQFGANRLVEIKEISFVTLLFRQFKSPLVLVLIIAAVISGLMYNWVNAIIILVIVFTSILISLKQEHSAHRAVEELKDLIALKSTVLRDGQTVEINSENLVPGDVVMLSAGSMVPADGRILECKDLFVNEAALTGESFPAEKQVGKVPASASIQQIDNAVFMGTSVRSGTAKVMLTETGSRSNFGLIAKKLQQQQPENDFERGIKNFSFLLTRIIFALVVIVFAINIIDHKSTIESLLFAVALAVGMTPELLPAIITINLSEGATSMAKLGVIIKKLNSIEILGSMDVLCTDKTGTLTEGIIELNMAVDVQGEVSDEVERLACINAALQKGLSNPLDEALLRHLRKQGYDFNPLTKADEIPYDFIRKRLTIGYVDKSAVDQNQLHLVSKGAFQQIISICSTITYGAEKDPLDKEKRTQLQQMFKSWSVQGFRVLGVATKDITPAGDYQLTKDDELDFTFRGFLLFYDPPKGDVNEVLKSLAEQGVNVKILTGDNRYVTRHIASEVHLHSMKMITGEELQHIKEEALVNKVQHTSLFVELDPQQKERIIRALKKTGSVTGFLGDGINDATALYEADIGISVDSAVDVAKDSADFVLMKHDLSVLQDGIEEGRKTFSNTLKYIFTTSSANFGNMISMAAASAMLPFLPLLAKQILLNNLLSDIPAISLANDRVDAEIVQQPQKWNIHYLRNFMITFGLVSTCFDFFTFGVLIWFFHARPDEFRTAWFMESLLTEIIIIFVIRTRRTFYASMPSKWLILNASMVAALTLAIPFLPLMKRIMGFIPLSPLLFFAIIGISVLYAATTEAIKKQLYHRLRSGRLL